MTKQVVAIDPNMPIGDVYALMQQRDIRHFPIVEDNSAGKSTLVGIVSDRDIRLVGSALPQAPKGVILDDPVRKLMSSPVVELSSYPNSLADLNAAVANQGINTLSILSSQDDPASGTLVVALRVTTINIGNLANHLRSQGFNVVWPPEALAPDHSTIPSHTE